jgi:alkylation response protein AidB-like acyl-CoA dehydrogenase
MTIALSAEILDDLRGSVRGVLERTASAGSVDDGVWSPAPLDERLWVHAGELGWTGLLANERWGGADAGLTATLAVVEELGAGLATIPYIGSAVLAVSAVERAGSDEQRARWVPGLAAGAIRGAAALTGPSGRVGIGLLGVCANRDGAGWRLSGRAGYVLDAPGADVLVVAARTVDGPTLFVVEAGAAGVEVTELLAIDRTRRIGHLTLDDVAVPADQWLASGDDTVIDTVTDVGTLAIAADACGAGRRALELSVEYAKQREQFGRPIGSFQAIKHKLADMWVLMTGAELAIAAAARAIDEGDPRAARLGRVACAYARDASTTVTGDAIQTHGGIGYTWEHPGHRLWKRAKFAESFLGDPSVHRERLAGLLLDTKRDVGVSA